MWLPKPLAVAALVIALTNTWAQTLPTTQAAPTAPAPQAWDSPQATVQTFVQDMAGQSYSDARNALDLSDVPFPVRDTEGDRYAQMLIAILARIHGFNAANFTDNPTGSSYSIEVREPNNRSAGSLVLEKGANGVWQFNSATVANLPRIYETVKRLPQTGAIGRFPDPASDPSMEMRAYMPRFLLHTFLWLEIWQWLGLAVLLVASLLLAALARFVTRATTRFVFRRWDKLVMPSSLRSLKRSAGLLAGVSLWWICYPFLGLEGQSLTLLTVIVLMKAFGIAAIAWLVDALIDIVLDSLRTRATSVVRRADEILIPIAKKFLRFIIFLAAILAFAGSMSVNVTGLVAGLGIGGLVIALAGKDSVENIFGSLTIIFDMPFGIGDWIKIDKAEGTVEEINLRSTRIRTSTDTLITLPNRNLITASIENFGARRFRRYSFTLPISYTNSLEAITKFCEDARKSIAENEKIRPDSSFVELNAMTDNALGALIQVNFLTNDYSEELRLRDQLISKLIRLAADAKLILGPLPWNPIPAPEGSGSSTAPTENKPS